MGLTKWEGYNIAQEDIFRFTHSDAAPWTVVRANDKRRTTLNAMSPCWRASTIPARILHQTH